MMTPFRPNRSRANPAVWLALASTSVGLAQVQPTSVSPEKKTGETVELSPFVVSTNKDVGYLAANTLSGTRLNTSLLDTPASISELTAEFLADINATNISNAVEYSLGFENDKPGANDNISQFSAGSTTAVARGLGRSRVVSRDYFPIDLEHDVFSLERISQSRGPNAILFGLGSAGGIINTTSKWANFKNATEVTFKADDHGSFRESIDFNKKLGDKVAFRVNLLNQDNKTWRDLEFSRARRMQLSTTLRPFRQTTVRAQFERGIEERLMGYRFRPRDFFTQWITAGSPGYNRVTQANTYPTGVSSVGANPFLVIDDSGQIANWQRFGTSSFSLQGGTALKLKDDTYVPATATIIGPSGTTSNDMWLGTVVVEQELLRNLFFEAGYNEAHQDRDIHRSILQGDIGVHIDPNQTLPSGAPNPNYKQYYVEGQPSRTFQEFRWRSWRATLAYELDTRNKWLGKHRWVGLATRAYDSGKPTELRQVNLTPLVPTGATALYSNAQNAIRNRTYVSQNGVFGDNGLRYLNQDPFKTPSAPVAFTDTANALRGTITPGYYGFARRSNTSDDRSWMFAGQSKVLAERLTVTYGWRHDKLDTTTGLPQVDPATNNAIGVLVGPVQSFSGDTKTVGAVVPVTKWFALYANLSDNFSPQNALDLTGNQIGNVKGKGRDIGVKVSVAGNKLYARAGYYRTTTANQSALAFTETTTAIQIWEAIEGTAGPHYVVFDSSGNRFDTTDAQVEGYEYELTANPIAGLSLTANYATLTGSSVNIFPRSRAYFAQFRDLWVQNASRVIPSQPSRTVATNLTVIDNLVQQYQNGEGNLATGNYKTSFNAFGRYRFQNSALKGWSVGAGARYRTNRIIGFTTTRAPIYAPSFLLVDASVGYQRKIWQNKIGMNLQVNASNLFDNTDPQWTNALADGTRWDYQLQNPRLLTLTATFSF